MGSLGFDELLVVVVIAIIVFGKDLPSVARKVGGWYSRLKRHVTDIKDELQRQVPEIDLESPPSTGPSPSANLPGPDPSDPESRNQSAASDPAPFDPARVEAPLPDQGHGTPPQPSDHAADAPKLGESP